MGAKLIAFFKKETILCVAGLLAVISMIWIPPDGEYVGYINWQVLVLLFCLMSVMGGLQALGIFKAIANTLLHWANGLRQLTLLLVLLCFFFAMVVTNDVALITFVPFTILLLQMADLKGEMIPILVLQTIAANLGSMATPIGNPQNLYLYSHYHLGMGAFLRIMLPFALLSLLLILLALLRGKNQPLSFGLSEMQTVSGAAPFCRKSLLSYLLMFLLCLGAVGKWIPIPFLLLAVVCLGLFADSAIFSKVDYSLLITFAGFFIFIGNMKQIPWISSLFQQLITGNELLCSVAVSQVISNVPAALLLSGFTDQGTSLLIGTNLGGLGTLIASMASLISYKYVARDFPGLKGKYLAHFTAMNVLFLAILLLAAAAAPQSGLLS